MSDTSVNIRQAEPSDTTVIAALGGQLGYPTSHDEAEERLTEIFKNKDQVVYVAEIEGDEVVGWIHVFGTQHLVMEPFAEIGALIVDESHRSLGVGRALVTKVEEWVLNHGYTCIRVRSNTTRDRAKVFYERLGYECQKTQSVFAKTFSE